MFKLSRTEWMSLLAAILFSAFCTYRESAFPLVMDEASYWRSASDIWNFGLFRAFRNSEVRTYGYPLLLSPLRALFDSDVIFGTDRFLFWILQFAIYLGASLVLRQSLLSRFSARNGRTAFCALMLCFWNLIYLPHALTETFSLSITIVLIAHFIRATRRRPSTAADIGIAFLLAGFAMMVRPSNLYLLPAVPIFFLVWNWRVEKTPRLVGKLLLFGGIGLGIPLSIQVRNNVTHYGKWTPLTAYPLGEAHLGGGIRYLKYATLRGIDSASGLYYHDPFFHIEDFKPTTTAIDWYLEHPFKGAALLLLSSFALVDQDLVRPYNPHPHPRLRWWGSIVNYLVLFLGGAGLWGFLGSAQGSPQRRALIATLAVAGLCFFGVHAPATVEARFGLPLITVLTAFVASGTQRLRAVPSRGKVITAGVLFVLFCAGLSGWMESLMTGKA